jgi:uncharacterized membrane protein SpoIIM required for sporulation
MILDLPRFIAAERASWEEFEALLGRIERDPAWRMELAEASRFHHLYQKVCADLAKIATFSSEPETLRYLESLVGRAYGEIHETRGRALPFAPWRWFWLGFPRAFRRRIGAFRLAIGITLLGVIFGGGAVALDDEAKETLMPAMFSSHLGSPAERVKREESAAHDRLAGQRSTFAGQLMANNIGVSIKALAFGMTWGVGTIVLLFYNGVILGLVAMDYMLAGQTVFLLGWLLPHGVVEIPAILIAGQAGLVLGGALIGHGDRAPLRERMRRVWNDVALLVLGFAVMLVWAGLVESFLSQYHEPVIPYVAKIAFGIIELVLLAWFLNRNISKEDDE